MCLLLLSYIGRFIDRRLSLYYRLYLQAGYNCEGRVLCSATFSSNLTPYESAGLWTETECHFEIRSWKCLTWKGGLESLALWTFSKSHRKYRQDNDGQAGALGRESLCGNEDLSVFSVPSYFCLLPVKELKLLQDNIVTQHLPHCKSGIFLSSMWIFWLMV